MGQKSKFSEGTGQIARNIFRIFSLSCPLYGLLSPLLDLDVGLLLVVCVSYVRNAYYVGNLNQYWYVIPLGQVT